MHNFGDVFENEVYTRLSSNFTAFLNIFSTQHIDIIEKAIKENFFNFPITLLQATLDNLEDIKNILLIICPNQPQHSQPSNHIRNIFTLIYELSAIIEQVNHIKKGAIGILSQKITKLAINTIKNICNHLSTRNIKLYTYM